MEKTTDFRRKTLEFIRDINNFSGCGARCPYGEMIEEAEASLRDGQSEWRDGPGSRHVGRWLTEAGRAALDLPTPSPVEGETP